VPDLELGKELREQGTRAGGSQSLSMEKGISGPPRVAPSYCKTGNRMCLDVVETAQSVDVFDEVRRADGGRLDTSYALTCTCCGDALRRPLRNPVFQSRGT
jgi:hypothetical protein